VQDFGEPLAALRTRLDEAETYLQIEELRARLPQLETEFEDPSLWDDPDKARTVNTEFNAVKEDLGLFDRLRGEVEDAETLYQLVQEESESSLEGEIAEGIEALRARFEELELRSLFSSEYDDEDATVLIKSGAGGTDAQDWAEMLLRMYLRWGEREGYEIELTSAQGGTEAGISNAEILVRGRYAYGKLQAEHGVHRLVRISPFNNEGKRQTAFASLYVAPFFEQADEKVEIDPKDLRIDTYRSSGAGGQHVNVTDSAVRITHLPTGIVTSCQNERSQHQNKDRAMQILAARLVDLERKKREDELAQIAGEAVNIDFGSQIRSYVLYPYQMVKDVRTKHEVANAEGVLDGDVDQFMESWLRWSRGRSGGE